MRTLPLCALAMLSCSDQASQPAAAPPPIATPPVEQTVAAPKSEPRFSAVVDLSKPGPDAKLILWHKQIDIAKVLGQPEVARKERARFFINNGPGEGDDVEIDVEYNGRGRVWKMEVMMTDAERRLAEIQKWLALPPGKTFKIGREMYRARSEGALTAVFVHLTVETEPEEEVFPDDPDRFMIR